MKQEQGKNKHKYQTSVYVETEDWRRLCHDDSPWWKY